VLGLAIAQWVLQSLATALLFPPVPMSVSISQGDMVTVWSGWWTRMGPSFALIGCILLWPRLAISIKRLHDRGKSGLWILLVFIPVLGWLWLLVDMGFLDGTPGPNKFGPSPKGLGAAAANA
jgi:uncharacterized membrane protein YhaH (DUF805 family)